MNRDRKILAGVLCVAFVLSSAPPFFAQQKQPAADVMIYQREKVIQGPDVVAPKLRPGEDAFFWVTSEMSFDGKLVRGAPYSAQAVTEMTQTLGDGNRIVNKSTVAIYRDSEGRTRREQALRAIGPFATGSEPPQTIFISDPVAGTSYVLDASTHVARKTSPQRFEFKIRMPEEGVKTPAPSDGAAPEPGKSRENVFVFTKPAPAGDIGVLANKVHGGDVVMTAPRMPGAQVGWSMEVHGDGQKNVMSESLGKQTVEGVEAEGSRSTVTIPAGDIGNERPILIVNERWYSPELQTVVMTRHSDPRFGETVYRLTNIDRSEPAKSLFEVPADYTIKERPDVIEGTAPPMKMRTRKPFDEQ